jgi:hypothetical protein
MLQELTKEPASKLGEGVSLCFACEDAVAIYREVTSRAVEASEPQVLNNLWTIPLRSERLPHRIREPDGCAGGYKAVGDQFHAKTRRMICHLRVSATPREKAFQGSHLTVTTCTLRPSPFCPNPDPA